MRNGWISTIEELSGRRIPLVRRLDFFPNFVVVWTSDPETVRARVAATVRTIAVDWEPDGELWFWVDGPRGWKGMVLKEIAE